jgi:hypothetical protein
MSRNKGGHNRIALATGILCLLAASLSDKETYAASPVQEIQKLLVQHRDRVAARLERDWEGWALSTQDAVFDMLAQNHAWDILGDFYNRVERYRERLLDELLPRLYTSTTRDSVVMFARRLDESHADALFMQLLQGKQWDVLSSFTSIAEQCQKPKSGSRFIYSETDLMRMLLDDKVGLASAVIACYPPRPYTSFSGAWDRAVEAQIEKQDDRAIEKTLNYPIQPDSPDRFLERSVLRAASRNDLSTLKTLLDRGGKPTAFEQVILGSSDVSINPSGLSVSLSWSDKPVEGFNALFYGISHDNVEMVQLLIDHGADPMATVGVVCYKKWLPFLTETERGQCAPATLYYGMSMLSHAKAHNRPAIIEVIESAIARRKDK